MPLDLLGGGTIEYEADRMSMLLLPDLTSDVVTVLELINETLTLAVEEKTTDTTESLSGKEFDLCLRLSGVDETSGVDLDLFEVNSASTDSHGHLLAITSAVVAVGGRKVPVLGTVLLQEGVLCEVGSIATSGENDGTLSGLGLATMSIFSTNNGTVGVLDELGDPCLLDNSDTLRIADSQILKALHLGVGNNHSRELSITTMCTRLAVATKSGDLGEIKTELGLKPVDGVTGAASKDADEIVAGKVTGLVERDL
jgi:hypothetical protein